MDSDDPCRPLVGISCCTKAFGAFAMPNHAASDTYIRATDMVVNAVPILLPANGRRVDCCSLIAHLSGLILTGSRSNVLPALYDGPAHPDDTPEDPERDHATLPLIRAALAAGTPVLAICRGLQELNVALGGTLHQRLQDLPGRIDHSTPMQANPRLRQGKAHAIRVTRGSWLHSVADGAATIAVNSLHNQGIDRLAPGLVVEGVAPDGVIEAVRVLATPAGPARGFGIGLQWHPEYDFDTDEVSRRVFALFGDAVRAHAERGRLTPAFALAAD